jgi:hypothetical protein
MNELHRFRFLAGCTMFQRRSGGHPIVHMNVP